MKDTVESIGEFLKEWLEEGRARGSSRWLVNLAIVFLVHNWKKLIELAMPTTPYTAQTLIEHIKTMFTGHSGLWYASLGGWWAFWVFGKPAVDTLMNFLQHKAKKITRYKKVEAIITRENMALDDYFKNQQSIESGLRKQVEKLKKDNEHLDSLLRRIDAVGVLKGERDIALNTFLESLRGRFRRVIREKQLKINEEVAVAKLEEDYKRFSTLLTQLIEITTEHHSGVYGEVSNFSRVGGMGHPINRAQPTPPINPAPAPEATAPLA